MQRIARRASESATQSGMVTKVPRVAGERKEATPCRPARCRHQLPSDSPDRLVSAKGA